MKKITQLTTMAFMMLFTTVIFAQSVIKGKVMDPDLNAPLPGANVIEKGTSNGTTTDFEGNFTLTTESPSGEIEITYVGFATLVLTFNEIVYF